MSEINTYKQALQEIQGMQVNYDPFEEKQYYIDLVKKIKLTAQKALKEQRDSSATNQ